MVKYQVFNEKKITRKQAAKLVHEYLRDKLHEPDEADISGAECLKDLYDCHTCVAHASQVFLKGIILPKSDREFGMNDELTAEELAEIEERIFDRKKRIPPHFEHAKHTTEKSEFFTKAHTEEFLWIPIEEIAFLQSPLIIDVRTPSEFEENHYPGAINIPFHRINLNPHIISDDKFRPIVLICNEGVNSMLAAEIAAAAGYREVYYSKY